jgi:release factor glutamine methyltransferase
MSQPPRSIPSGAAPTRSRVVGELRAAGCVFAEEEAELLFAQAADPGELAAMVARRVAGEPLEQVVGWAEFAGRKVAVAPGVFVPRRRTEFLVRQAVARARAGAVVLDLCCGTGALGLAVAGAVPGVELHAADLDPAAVACARGNLAPIGGHVHEGDLYAPLPEALRGRVDVLLANTPYVPSADIALLPAEARDHEPRTALDGGPDGLDVQRRVVAAAPGWLAPGGHLLVEVTKRQLPYSLAVFAAAGLRTAVEACDETEATVVIGTRAG